MSAAVSVPFILGVVAACPRVDQPVLQAPAFAFEVAAHAQGESGRRPFYVRLNAAPGRDAEPRDFATAAEAVAFTERGLADGRSVDVGLMQVNLRAHPDAFSRLADAFDPAMNICAGAAVLADAYREVREARCVYNSGRRDCRSPSGTNGYPEAIAAAERRLRSATSIAAVADAEAPPSPAQVPDPSIPAWDVFGQARMARNSER